MIGKQDILDRAAEWQLRPEIVEKDYVLGWILAAIARHAHTSASWIFKGGTCLKKCFFETYRFSEDLDFTLLPEAAHDQSSLRTILQEVARDAADLSGIDFPEDLVVVNARRDKSGRDTYQARIAYRGPLAYPGPPRILLDLTQHEPVMEPCSARSVFHPYPDELPAQATVATYAIEELFAEKTRALFERTRPRDLYDVVYVLENLPEIMSLPQSLVLFHRKCAVKGLKTPTAAELVAQAMGSEELHSEWANMLEHQLPQLPPIQFVLDRLPALLATFESIGVLPAAALPSASDRAGEEVIAPVGAKFWGGGVPLEVARFAGANRLLIKLTYHGTTRLVEPYSLRRASTGSRLLYGWELEDDQIKAFKVDKIEELRSTSSGFTPRFRVEFSMARPSRTPSLGSKGSGSYAAKPRYVFQCGFCSKEFRHSKNDSKLRKHKAVGGYMDCPGRRGYLLRTE